MYAQSHVCWPLSKGYVLNIAVRLRGDCLSSTDDTGTPIVVVHNTLGIARKTPTMIETIPTPPPLPIATPSSYTVPVRYQRPELLGIKLGEDQTYPRAHATLPPSVYSIPVRSGAFASHSCTSRRSRINRGASGEYS